ncbi:RNA pseudouridylate synthase domain-containing protein 2-like isoform X2 [Diprion similis]|uniref:RNA pseudouridylate synthase domain-containing protein 2-like isoform X2 n=1 Tax=Diprion similis TaxID=362088 RepID=UPI001EF81E00|nr:RNA pseudouridylate synthase domain-containing protein 2-like isoform X2 [Diprion similis]
MPIRLLKSLITLVSRLGNGELLGKSLSKLRRAWLTAATKEVVVLRVLAVRIYLRVSSWKTTPKTTMVETAVLETITDKQTQFGHARLLDCSDCIFVFQETLSDYEEPTSDAEVDLKPLREPVITTAAPKLTEKRKAEDADVNKDLKKAKLETKALKAKRPGFTDERYNETSYYVENGLRKVYPYYFTFTTFTKGRWVGEKILEVFAREFRAHPAEEYERCIRAGTLTVNYQRVEIDYRLRHNDLLANVVHRHEVPVTSEPITVVHMDEDLVVVNKPASIPVHPCGRYRHNTVVFILAKEYNLKNLRTIHRLDRLTSGILLFGRTPKKARQMEHQIRNRQVHKEYVCRVDGEFPEDEVVCAEPIEVVSYKIGVCKVSEKGKDCVTTFKRLSFNGKSSVVLCKPQTGRMHQIRVHLQYLGYPVVNDPLYNHVVFGPMKGKGGNIGKTDEELVKDLIGIHNAENWLGMDGDSEMSLFKPKLDIEDQVLATNDKDAASPSSSPSPPEEDLKALKVTVGTQTGSEPPDSSFANEKVTTDPHCYECKVKYRDPKPSDLVMYLHAWRYRGPGWEYETPLPAWAGTDWGRETPATED